jgi:proteic killer suppression protein
VQIFFPTTGLKKLCNDDRLLQKKFGVNGMKKIRQRLDEFEAASTLADIGKLPGPRCEELKGNRAGELSVRAHDGMRIIFRPFHSPIPAKPDGGLDWAAVTSIQVTSIEDYHD